MGKRFGLHLHRCQKQRIGLDKAPDLIDERGVGLAELLSDAHKEAKGAELGKTRGGPYNETSTPISMKVFKPPHHRRPVRAGRF